MSFDTLYFERIIGTGWTIETTSEGKSQWGRADEAISGEMMLNTDMCLAYQSGRAAPWTRAEDTSHSGCCLWLNSNNAAVSGVQCHCHARSPDNGTCSFSNCCASTGGCPNSDPFSRSRLVRFVDQDESLAAITKYANSATGMNAWHDDFIPTWGQVTTQGHEDDLCTAATTAAPSPTASPTPDIIIGMPIIEEPVIEEPVIITQPGTKPVAMGVTISSERAIEEPVGVAGMDSP